MGDGRYYTLDQFFTIVMLTFLVVFATASLWISYYKNHDKKVDWFLITTLFFIDAYAILKFVEELYMFEETCMLIRYVELSIIIVNYIIFLYYLLVRFYKNNSIKVISTILFITTPIVAITFASIKWRTGLLLSSYSFSRVVYSMNYSYILLSIVLIYIACILLVYYKSRKNNESSRVRLLVTILLILYVFPLVAYISMVFAKSLYIKWIEISIAYLSCVTVDLILNYNVSYGLTPFTFDKIKSVMNDYVFVTDINGKIIFRNENTIRIDLFNESKCLDVDCIRDIFYDNNVSVNIQDGKNYIRLIRDDNTLFYSFRYKELIDSGNVIGRIITFVDISQLMELLEQLKAQEEKTLETNKKLHEYKDVVYYLEKENEINTLLEEIITVQEKSMFEIMGRIDSCTLKIETQSFQRELNSIIALTNKNLEEVRKAVTAYREYYGGNK